MTYDRRGFGESALDDPLAEVSLETHREDAHALLAALTTEPALVFGSSAGALIGLDLVISYPQQVSLLIAHEPAARGFLPAFDQAQERHHETFRRDGALAAFRQIMLENGTTYEQREAGVEFPPVKMQAAAANAELLFKYTFPAIQRYRLDPQALKKALSKVLLACGNGEQPSLVYQCTLALAENLDTSVVAFPGNHTGYITHPGAFAERLREERAEN